jgi:hypothetical protein
LVGVYRQEFALGDAATDEPEFVATIAAVAAAELKLNVASRASTER